MKSKRTKQMETYLVFMDKKIQYFQDVISSQRSIDSVQT